MLYGDLAELLWTSLMPRSHGALISYQIPIEAGNAMPSPNTSFTLRTSSDIKTVSADILAFAAPAMIRFGVCVFLQVGTVSPAMD